MCAWKWAMLFGLLIGIGLGDAVAGVVHPKVEPPLRCALSSRAIWAGINACAQENLDFVVRPKNIRPPYLDVDHDLVATAKHRSSKLFVTEFINNEIVLEEMKLLKIRAIRNHRLRMYGISVGCQPSVDARVSGEAPDFVDSKIAGNSHIARRGLSCVGNFNDDRNSITSEYVSCRHAVEVSPYLGFSKLAGYLDGGVSGNDSRASGIQRSSQEPNRPRAEQQSHDSGRSHNPSRPTFAENQIVILARIFGGTIIMFCAGWFSWRDFGDNRRRFYDGLALSGVWIYWLFGRLLLG